MSAVFFPFVVLACRLRWDGGTQREAGSRHSLLVLEAADDSHVFRCELPAEHVRVRLRIRGRRAVSWAWSMVTPIHRETTQELLGPNAVDAP